MRLSELERENGRLAEENGSISRLAEQPLALERENQRLKEGAAVMVAELERLKGENGELKASVMQKWFMAGGGVLLAGILLGVLLPRLRGRQRSIWH